MHVLKYVVSEDPKIVKQWFGEYDELEQRMITLIIEHNYIPENFTIKIFGWESL